jgi:hypothetical protein
VGMAAGVADRSSSGRWTGAAGPFGRGEGRRDPPRAPSTRGRAAQGATPAVDVGGPGDHRGPHAAAAADPAAQHARQAGDDPGVASASGRSAVDHHGHPATGSTVNPWRSPGAGGTTSCGGTTGGGQPRLGIPAHPQRVGRARSPGRGLDGLGDPEGRGVRSGPTPVRADLATVPDRPKGGHRGLQHGGTSRT